MGGEASQKPHEYLGREVEKYKNEIKVIPDDIFLAMIKTLL